MQIVELLAKEKGWWRWRARSELKRASKYLDTFVPAPPTKEEIKAAETPSSV